jgi:copper transport protein
VVGIGHARRVIASRSLRSRPGCRSTALLATLAGLIVLLLAATAPPASAHAMLVEADPADRTRVASAPSEVVLTFNEPVTPAPDGVRVFDAEARRVDEGQWRDASRPELVGAQLPGDLPDGGYVVTYRVLSADSHPISGALTFTVGDGREVDDATVADLFGGAGNEWTGVVGPLLRGLGYLGTLVAAGAVLFAAAVASSPRDRRSARWLGARAIGLAVVATVLAVPVQAAAVTGRGPLEVFAPGAGLGATLFGSSFGQSTLLRIVGLSWLWLSWRFTVADDRSGPRQHLATGVAAVLMLGSYLLDGHQRSVEPTWLLAGADLVHLLGAAAWAGGLVLTAVAVRRRRLEDDPVGAARVLGRFSAVALWSVVALGTAGVAMSWVLVRTPRALITTGYGWTLLAKVVVVAMVLVVATYNRQRLVPAVTARLVPAGGAGDGGGDAADVDAAGAGAGAGTVEGETGAVDRAGTGTAGDRLVRRSRAAWAQLRTTMLIEVVGVALVIALTGFLVSQRPAAEAAGVTGAFEATAELTDELEVDLIVDPNRAGRNAMHVYVLDQTGRPAAAVDDLRIELLYVPESIGPFELEPFFVGPGHWTATIDELAFPGAWQVRLVVGVDRFTEATAEITVVVNP